MKNVIMLFVMIISGMMIFKGNTDDVQALECARYTEEVAAEMANKGHYGAIVNCKTKEVQPLGPQR